MRLGECISEDAIEQYAMNKLPESEMEPLEEHLLVCLPCQDRVQLADEFLAVLRAAANRNAEEAPGGEEAVSYFRAPQNPS